MDGMDVARGSGGVRRDGVGSEQLLRRLLWLDFASCAGMAVVLAGAGGVVERVTGLPGGVRIAATAILIAAAAVMALTAMRRPLVVAAVWLVILGHLAWVVASLGLLGAGALTGAGVALVLVQAVAVAGLTGLEALVLRRVRAV